MSMSNGEPLLDIEELELTYEDETAVMEAIPESVKARFDWTSQPIRAVDGVSLEIDENDVVAVIGESGSGKTSFGKTVIGLQEPTGGSIRYRGYDIWELKRRNVLDDMEYSDFRKGMQIVHQDAGAALNPYQTILTILKEPLILWYPELDHADYHERVLEMLRVCGLTPAMEYVDRYPHELSGGEQQRIALVRAMLVEPDLILADEPVSALDPSLRIDLMDLMLELQDMFNTSFLFITHNLEAARYITLKADGEIAIMYLGEIVERGPADEVLENPQHPYTQVLKWATLHSHPDVARELLEEEPPLRDLEAPDVTNVPSGCRFHTRCPKAKNACVEDAPDHLDNGDPSHTAACHRLDPNHPYWDSEWLDDEGEIEIVDRF